jgi:hypothetical protein
MKNKTVYLTVIGVSLIYLLLIMYARHKDKKDVEKLGVTPLPANHKFDQYFYQIIVFTGHRRHAGTKSNVHFILKQLLSFAMMFSIVFMAFICLFYFLFVSQIWSCSSLLNTAEMLSQMIVMKYNVHDLIEVAPFFGPFCFSLFIFLVVFVCMSMFLTIINQSFRYVRNNINYDQKIFSFMLNKFQYWTGLKLFYFQFIVVFFVNFRFEKIK